MQATVQPTKVKTVICLKWGTKYPPQYVNVLYNMVKRYSTVDIDFICLTENPTDLDKNIIIKSLPNINLHGWWMKPYVFSKELNLKGDVLFLDLDIVICNSIDKLWTYKEDKFMIIKDFTRCMSPGYRRFNSSVYRFPAEEYYWIWDDFYKDYKNIVKKHHGDQDFLFEKLQNIADTWPIEWIQSYKWEIRDQKELTMAHGKRNFNSIVTPTIPHGCSITVFHGDPKPSECKDPWVINAWK